MRKNYALLDVIRLVMAVLVLYIHVPAFADSFEEVNYLLKYGIARLAVPFFFICNGYFSFSENIANIKLQARKMLQLYCIWTLIYSPIILYNFVIDPRKSILMKTLLILRDFLLIGSYSQLWYLLAAALGFLLLYSMLQAH
ncbi:acyltransferase family protein [Allofournierella sp.]|uniref:acyltransferase family protein n=1 Tax=Allofournierella sp. TaxID=1940256 RepID=UPI003AB6CCC9